MTLNQIAQQAMDYLDSVGVAADWGVYSYHMLGSSVLKIVTGHETFYQSKMHGFSNDIIADIKKTYPQKSPA